MTTTTIITDPFLLSVLSSSAETKAQCLALLDLTSSRHIIAAPSNDTSSPASDAPATPVPEIDAPSTNLTISEHQRWLFSQVSKLRGLNREAIIGVRETKHVTAEARQEVDRLHLQLQNLYYEQRYLRGEIALAEGFDHKYRQLPLISVEEFLALHPELENDDEDPLMVARIDHEHSEREALEQARQELLKKKQALIAENKKRKEDLANLDKDLEKFIDAAKPIQKTFEKEY